MKKVFDNIFFKIIFGFIKFLFISVIILYLGFILVQRVTGNKSVFGYRLFTVATGSMSGVYEINDVIAVKDCDVNKLKVGDDIAYRGSRGGFEGMLITHRIIKIEEAEGKAGKIFTTKGVNAPVADPSITDTQIFGKVVGIVPIITPINHIVKTQLGFFLCVFCPLVFVIVLEILQTITDMKIEKNEIREVEKKEKKKSKKKSTKDVEKEDLEEKESSEDVEKEDSEEKESSEDAEKEDSKEEESTEDMEKDDSKEEESTEDAEKEDSEAKESTEDVEKEDIVDEPVIREVIEISKDEKRESEAYTSVPEIEEDKTERDNIEIL
ncbi:MAG: signal peptidase I [Bacilli bacterium]|nr:signal peptidase I [Bacilli bacterium]